MPETLKANNLAWAARMVAADADFFRRLERQQSPAIFGSAAPTVASRPTRSWAWIPARCSCTAMSPISLRRRTPTTSPCCSSRSTSSRSSTSWWSATTAAAACGRGRRASARSGRPLAAPDPRGLLGVPGRARGDRRREARLRRLCELNVTRQARNVASDVFVLDAWARGQELAVHGWVYSVSTGHIKDLRVSVAGPG